MSETPIAYRLLEPSDTAELAELFGSVWPGQASHRDDVDWAFGDPRAASLGIVAVDSPNGPIVGARGSVDWPLTGGSQSQPAVRQLHGTCVHPDYHRRGIFTEMNRRFLELYASGGGDLIFNVSVSASRSGYEKLGWVYGPGLRRLIKPVKRARVAVALIGGRSRVGGTPTVEPATGSPPEFSRVVDHLAARRHLLRGTIATDYSESFLGWRLSKRNAGYRFVSTDSGTIVYRVGWRGSLRELYIGDTWLSSSDRSNLGRLVSAVIEIETPDLVTLLMTRTHPLYGDYRRLGFLSDPKGDLNLGARAISKQGEDVVSAWNWAISSLDIDTF